MPKRTWTKEDERFLLNDYRVMNSAVIGEQLGKSAVAVRIRLHKMGRRSYLSRKGILNSPAGSTTNIQSNSAVQNK